MTISAAPLQTQIAAARVALAETLLLKVGQVLEALVLGTSADGTTSLRLGDQVVLAKLPQPLPAGTVLQVQVKSAGTAPELAVLKQISSPVVATGMRAPVVMPAEPGGVAAASRVLPDQAMGRGMAPAAQVAPHASVAAAPVRSAPVRQALSGGPEPATDGARAAFEPAATSPMRAASAGVPSSTTPEVPVSRPAAPPAALATQSTTPVEVETVLPPIAAPQGEDASGGSVIASEAPAQPAHSSVAAEATAQGARAVASTAAAQPAAAPDVVAAPQPAAPVAGAMSMPEAPVIGPAPAAMRAAPGVAVAVAEDAGHPLLVAQAMPRAAATVTDLPRMSPAAPPAAPQPAQGPPQPTTPEAAVVQALPQALARQNSLGPLLVSLAVAVSRPGLLPEPVARLARQVLAQRVIVSDGRVAPEELARAVDRSGVLLEAKLAGGDADPLDLKSLLVGLRERLASTRPAGPEASPRPAPEGARRAAPLPPLRGLPLRAEASAAPSLSDLAKDALRVLHDQSDAAVSRIKLAQIASLPDRSDPARPMPPLLRLEVPFLYGHELVMAQIAVGRDGGRRSGERKRGWTLKFALNSAATGEVGADVGLLGKAVNVALWAADPKTAEAFTAQLPDLRRGLEAAGLSPTAVRVRRGPPEPEPTASGKLLDSMS